MSLLDFSEELVSTARLLASPGKGILAVDESTKTIGKRLGTIGVENTEANRQAYRGMLFTTAGLGEFISGAILYEETLFQSHADGESMVSKLAQLGIVPGIKVDKGLRPLPGANSVETLCTGLDGLVERAADYYAQVLASPSGSSATISSDGCPTPFPSGRMLGVWLVMPALSRNLVLSPSLSLRS